MGTLVDNFNDASIPDIKKVNLDVDRCGRIVAGEPSLLSATK